MQTHSATTPGDPDESAAQIVLFQCFGVVFVAAWLMSYFGMDEITVGVIIVVSCIAAFVYWVKKENAAIAKWEAEQKLKTAEAKLAEAKGEKKPEEKKKDK